jgi:hypothetical protein
MRRNIEVLRMVVLAVGLTKSLAAADTLASAVESGDVTRVEELLRANPPLPGADCGSLARSAISRTHAKVLEILLSYASKRGQMKNCEGTLEEAIASGNKSVVEAVVGSVLRESRPDTRSPASKPWQLHDAARRGKADVIRMLVKLGSDVNQRDADGSSALHAAALNGQTDAVTTLLALGADVNAKNGQGATPLHEAALGGRTAVIEQLLGKGGVLDSRDLDGSTPLFYAAAFGRRAAVEVLLKAGADPTARTNKGRDARSAAEAMGETEIIKLLDARSGPPVKKPLH